MVVRMLLAVGVALALAAEGEAFKAEELGGMKFSALSRLVRAFG